MERYQQHRCYVHSAKKRFLLDRADVRHLTSGGAEKLQSAPGADNPAMLRRCSLDPILSSADSNDIGSDFVEPEGLESPIFWPWGLIQPPVTPPPNNSHANSDNWLFHAFCVLECVSDTKQEARLLL